jgi:hypothetical protein
MAGLRDEAMALFVKELVVALAKENYRFDDLLQGLASYADERADWVQVVKHLEDAAEEVVRVRKDLTGGK